MTEELRKFWLNLSNNYFRSAGLWRCKQQLFQICWVVEVFKQQLFQICWVVEVFKQQLFQICWVVEVFVNVYFTVQTLILISVYPSKKLYFSSLTNWIDIISVMPFYLRLIAKEYLNQVHTSEKSLVLSFPYSISFGWIGSKTLQ